MQFTRLDLSSTSVLVGRYDYHRYTSLDEFFPGDEARDGDFRRYDSPLERKGTARMTTFAKSWLETHHLREVAKLLRLTSLGSDPDGHYTSLYRYDPGDHLCVHTDAAVHPNYPSLRRLVTLLFYIDTDPTSGPLEFWAGDPTTDERPQLYEKLLSIPTPPGTVIAFLNTDWAWHGVPLYTGDRPRLVASTAFMGPVDLPHPDYHFQSLRQRAYFAPRHDEHWDQATYDLRDLRADPVNYHKAWRAGS